MKRDSLRLSFYETIRDAEENVIQRELVYFEETILRVISEDKRADLTKTWPCYHNLYEKELISHHKDCKYSKWKMRPARTKGLSSVAHKDHDVW